ncbi:hypothetical protein A3A09_00695 [Candidatus Nomurabacteria bacterium RIFCSPLOWO2_01_FULL_42_20]|uniref:GxxExxY protein n=1 Tax=Candidatus Nomurabacteria bacterium RIFCSPHIGHO2_01_FULL_42_16 TaxID=1801743 RepID=A0A1F6VLU7_9BACT|nr:MAG: hypothetical protein A2824_02210 [Candidatus Nomurabacteria bacterium RIFCSPHIGHO2_01_FULL_42_16]OGI92286.1 MAG: hypothetical protein A3A09_00695 [Candidatus Nomurabacteria bacterium RIFCSPLOWO2_01_FULL_42_20]
MGYNLPMNKEKGKLVYEDESYKIRGACFSVYNNLGSGHKELVYQKALAIELEKANLQTEREKTLPINYAGEKIGYYKPDFIIEKKIIIEIKAVPFMPKDYEQQLIHYLKGTNFKLGFLINFGSNKLDIRRRIN